MSNRGRQRILGDPSIVSASGKVAIGISIALILLYSGWFTIPQGARNAFINYRGTARIIARAIGDERYHTVDAFGAEVICLPVESIRMDIHTPQAKWALDRIVESLVSALQMKSGRCTIAAQHFTIRLMP